MDGGGRGVFKIVKSAGQTQGHVMNSFPDFQLLCSVFQLRRARFDTRAQTDEAFECGLMKMASREMIK